MNFFILMGNETKRTKEEFKFEICSVGNIAIRLQVFCLALLYVMTIHIGMKQWVKRSQLLFWSYWLKLVGIYIIIQIVVQKLFVRYVNKRI